MAQRWGPLEVLTAARSYQTACVLAAAVDWDLFNVLGNRRMSAWAVAAALGTDLRATTALLDALVALELLDKDDAEYAVPPDVMQTLTDTGDRSVLSMARHHANCLRKWVQLAHTVKTGGPAAYTPSLRGEAADQIAFIGAMHDVSGPTADDLVAEIAPPVFHHLLDVGGASGTWTIAFLKAAAGATATLFDLPHVIPLAERQIQEAGLSGRVTLQAGDFYKDELPGNADLVWLSAIAHQNSREQNRTLFRKVNRALTDNGILILRDDVMDESHTQPAAGAMFAINMLVATQGGGTYALSEHRDDLLATGFAQVELIRQDEGMNSMIRAAKPQQPR